MVQVRLSVMMFLQFFIWGAWYVTAPNYLGTIGFSGGDFAWTYSVGPIAGMITPLFIGMIADRFFAAQRVLALLHIGGAAIMYGASQVMAGNNPAPSTINWVFLGYMLTYFPTLALTNTVAMRNMGNPEKQFPMIRVWGTIGWIAANVVLSWQGWDTSIDMFYLTSGSALVLGLLSFALPHTPANKGTRVSAGDVLGLKALVLLKDPSYLIFILCSMLICIPLAFYYQIASRVVEMVDFSSLAAVRSVAGALQFKDVIAATMSFGQISEIFFMLVMPFFFRRLGVKWMLLVGMLAWVVRYALFAFGSPEEVRWMIFVGVLLHGICYDFFFVTGQIYTDKKAPEAIRGQAQGLLVMLTLGLGMLIGAQTAGKIEGWYTTSEAVAASKRVETIGPEVAALQQQFTSASADEKTALDEQIAQLEEEKSQKRMEYLRNIDWKPLWGIPAIFAGIIMLLFALMFREDSPEGRPAS
ncbi:MAG: MFS transporter [Planctomycetaceae bacterium]|nr:MFS transporter [Planctomycetaceae bacterium]MBP61938.1 MFS transporter [Planctomycetaceae bacterium]